MAMNAPGRAQAIYNVIAQANSRVAQMSATEKNVLLQNLQTIFGGDLAYIQANAEVPGMQYQAPAGASVTTSGGPTSQAGATTSPVTITGTGKVF